MISRSKKKRKRIFSLILTAALVLTSVLEGGTLPALNAKAAQANPEVVYENDFETGLNGFVNAGNAVVECSNEIAGITDGSSMKVSGGSADWHGARLEQTGMDKNASYELSTKVYSEEAVQVVMQLVLLKAGGGDDYKWLANATLIPGQWTELSATIDITADEYDSIKYLSFENKTAPYNSAYYVDDIKIVKTKDLSTGEETDPQPEVIYDNDFEIDLNGFVNAGNAVIEHSNEVSSTMDGFSMKVSGGSADWHGARLEQTGMNSNASYEIKAKVYSEEAVQVVMQLVLLKAGGGDDYKWLANATLTPGQWTELSATIDITAEEYDSIKYLSFENKTAPYDSAYYVDDVRIIKTKDLSSGGELPGEGESKPEMPVIDFENGTTNGFTGRGGIEVLELTTEKAHSGEHSLKISNRTADWNGPSLQIEDYIAQGKEYKITAWVHAASPQTPTKFSLSTQIGNGSGASYNTIASTNISAADGWVELTGKYRYANTSSEYITIYVENSDKNAEYYIDDISVVELKSDINADLTLPSLAEIYKDYFLLGNVFSQKDLAGIRFELLKHHFNTLTPENAMKPDAMAKEKDNYSFEAVDSMIGIIASEDMKVHGHTLGWHQQTSAWLNQNADGGPLTRLEAEENLKAYVENVAGHYAGQLISWDVLNEAMNDNPSSPSDWRASLRKNSPWYLAFSNVAAEEEGNGEDFIEMLFREARKADPNAKLYYNDYNLDNQNKATAVANMVKEINDKWLLEGHDRKLIEGVGMQGHYNLNTSIANVENSIRRFKEIGVNVSISELDVTVPATAGGITEENELKQAAQYARLFKVFKQYAGTIERVTIWGLDDGSSWRSTQYPLLFNSDLSAKEAYYAVADPEGFLDNYQEPGREPVDQGISAYGTPVIDGTQDTVWSKAAALPISKMLQAWNTASGTARVLWDENNLYVLAVVNDTELDNTAGQPHERDSVEVFFDESNCKSGPYSEDDGQYRVGFDGETSFGGSTNSQGFEAKVKVDGTTYTVEMKIPFKTIVPKTGEKIGFDVQINDAKNGARAGVAIWCDTSGDSWQNNSKWGELTLHKESENTSPGGSHDDSSAPSSNQKVEEIKNQDGGTTIIYTTKTVDANGNDKIEIKEIVKDANGKFVSETLKTEIHDKKTGATVVGLIKKDEAGKTLESNLSVVTGMSKAVQKKANIVSVNLTIPGDIMKEMIKGMEEAPNIVLEVPAKQLKELMESSKSKTIEFIIPVSKEMMDDNQLSGGVIMIPKDVILSAKDLGKVIKGVVREEGKSPYAWIFKADTLKASADEINDVVMNLNVQNADKNLPANSTVITFLHSGNLPATAQVKTKTNSKAGTLIYLYYINEKTNQLEEQPNNQYKVDKAGYVIINAAHCSGYLLSTKKLAGSKVISLADQIGISYNKETSAVEVMLSEALKKVDTLSGKNTDPAVMEVAFSYQSSDTKIAAVNKSGKITPKKNGKITITVTAKLENGEKKIVTLPVTVKK